MMNAIYPQMMETWLLSLAAAAADEDDPISHIQAYKQP